MDEMVVVPVVVQNEEAGLVRPQEKGLLEIARSFNELDWRKLKPHQTALLLMRKPFPSRGGGSLYLSFAQALLLAVRCHELGVSPFSNEVWFDPDRGSVNLTLEGKRVVARNMGLDLGPPTFTRLERDWTEVPRLSETAQAAKQAGFVKDVGMTCRMRIGPATQHEFVEYTAWLSEWFQPKSPVWLGKPEHMLQIRATEKAISLALGTGISALPDEQELGSTE